MYDHLAALVADFERAVERKDGPAIACLLDDIEKELARRRPQSGPAQVTRGQEKSDG